MARLHNARGSDSVTVKYDGAQQTSDSLLVHDATSCLCVTFVFFFLEIELNFFF